MKENTLVSSIQVKKYLFWAVMLLLVLLSFFMLRPYLISLASAFILAFLIRPLYLKLEQYSNKKTSALLCVILLALVILIPIIFIAKQIALQASDYAGEVRVNAFVSKISSLPFLQHIDIPALKEKIISLLFSLFASSIRQAPAFLLGIVITLVAMFFILVYWKSWSTQLIAYIPFKNKEHIADEIALATKNIVYGYFLIALIELTVAFIGFSLAGVKFALIFAVLIAMLAFIPGLGPFIIWAPLALAYMLAGNIPSSIGILITGLVISLFIDHFLSVKIVASKTKINPLMILLGILGGVPLFGIFGLVIGPLVLLYTLKLLQEAMQQTS